MSSRVTTLTAAVVSEAFCSKREALTTGMSMKLVEGQLGQVVGAVGAGGASPPGQRDAFEAGVGGGFFIGAGDVTQPASDMLRGSGLRVIG